MILIPTRTGHSDPRDLVNCELQSNLINLEVGGSGLGSHPPSFIGVFSRPRQTFPDVLLISVNKQEIFFHHSPITTTRAHDSVREMPNEISTTSRYPAKLAISMHT